MKWTNRVSVAIFGLLLSMKGNAAQSTATSMTVNTGTSNGTVEMLALANDGQIVSLYTNRKGVLRAVFKYPAAGLSNSIGVSGVLRQYTAADTFNLQAQNSSGAWVSVGSITGSNATRAISMGLPSGIVVNGVISLRLISSDVDDIDVDQLIVKDLVATPTPAPAPEPAPDPVPTSSVPPGTSYLLQLQGSINMSVPAKVYDIDLYDNSAATFAALKQAGHTVICYFSAGSYENWRSDASLFPASALGNNLSGWPGERWLDTRNLAVRDIMAKRMDVAKSKGCDGIDPDNVDGYSNNTGFPLTMQDQINYNTFLADQAHARGLLVALKNSTDLVNALVSKFDFAVVEECFRYNECSAYSPFINQGKAVLNVEYSTFSSSICTQAANLKFSTVFYNLALDGTVYKPCP